MIHTQRLFILFFLSLFVTSPSYTAEVDQYTANDNELYDALDALNHRANLYLQRAITRSNLHDLNCNEESLYKELQYYFANHSKGQFSKDLLYDNRIPKIVIPLESSLYNEWSVWNGYLLGRDKAKDSPLALGPLVKIGNRNIGTDKFEHLFGMGFTYFEKYYQKKKKLTSVLKYGIILEKTILGGNVFATGVFSYADLVANFNGMRFWNHMLQKNDDIFGAQYNVGPFVSCFKGKWVKNKDINFSEYFDDGVDESINCSKFATKSAVRKVRKYTKSYEQKCLKKDDFLPSLEKYNTIIPGNKKGRPLSHYLLNREGHEKLSYFNEF